MVFIAVDDERLQLNKLVDAIKVAAPNNRILSFDNPLTALKNAELQKIDVAFLDIEMAGLNGVELAKKLKAINPNINIVFVTGYTEYAVDAYSIHASGYLTKPVTADKIKAELNDLRFPMPEPQSNNRIRIQCFGDFEIFCDGEPLKFSRSKTKELVAYLVDSGGALVTTKEISMVLFNEDKPSYVRNLIADLSKALKEVDAEKIFVKRFNKYGISMKNVRCDYYDYLNNIPYAVKAYRGKYMSQYKWEKKAKI